MMTRSRTGHNDTQTPCCHRQGSAQNALMGEDEKQLSFSSNCPVHQRNPAAEYLRHQHVWGCWGRPPGVFTLPTKHNHKWQAQQEVFMWGWQSGRYDQPFGMFLNAYILYSGVPTGFLWHPPTSSNYSFWRPACWWDPHIFSNLIDANQNLLRYDWKKHIPVAVEDQGWLLQATLRRLWIWC